MAEIVDFGLQQHKIKMDNSYFDNGLSVVAGDTGRRIEVQLLDTNGMVQDTTGLNLRLNAEIAGKATYTDATLVDAATGKYQLDLSNGMFLAPGNWQFQWQITDSAGKKLHSFAFTGNVGKNISEGGSQAANFYLNLDDLKAMQDDLINGTIDSEALETNIAEKLTGLETEYAPKLAEVTAQLAQTVDRLDGSVTNTMFPPVPFLAMKPDGNYYDEANHKYYKDADMLVPSTDNTPILQALVDYMKNKGGGTLFVPEGKFVFRSKIDWKSKVSLVGAGKGVTSLFAEGAIFSLITGLIGVSNGSDALKPEVWFDDCSFTDFLIDNKGLSHTAASVDGKGLFILYMRRALFRDLIFLNTIGSSLGCDFLVDTVIENVFTYRAGRNSIDTIGYGGNSGIGVGTSALSEEPLVISNCFTYNSGNYGIFVETQNNPNGSKAKCAKIINCHSSGNKLGFGNKGSGGTQFIGCTATHNKSHGFHLTQGVEGDQLIACVSEKNLGEGIRVERDCIGNLEISNTSCCDNDGAGIRLFNSNATLNNVRIAHVRTHGNGLPGVWIGGNTKNIKIIDVDAINNGKKRTSKQDRGILIEGTNDVVSVLGNTIYDDQLEKTQKSGLDISSGTTNYIVDSNNITGYDKASGYIIKSTTGKIGTNVGYEDEKSGKGTIPAGQLVSETVHALGAIPKIVITTPMSTATTSQTIWLDKVNGNVFRVRREVSEGALDFYWQVKL